MGTTGPLLRQLKSVWAQLRHPAATLTRMHPALTELHGVEQLDELLAASGDRPLLLFKYSATCGTSAQALDELFAHLDQRSADVTYAVVTVQTHREVSNAIARTLGVRHETPQALLVRDGQMLWTASHYRVTADAVETALKEFLGDTTDRSAILPQPTVQ